MIMKHKPIFLTLTPNILKSKAEDKAKNYILITANPLKRKLYINSFKNWTTKEFEISLHWKNISETPHLEK